MKQTIEICGQILNIIKENKMTKEEIREWIVSYLETGPLFSVMESLLVTIDNLQANKNIYPDPAVKTEAKAEADIYSKYDLTHKEIFSSLVDVDTVLLNMGDKLINEYGVNPNYVRNIVISLLDRLYIIRTALNKQHFESYDSKDELINYQGG